MKRLRFTGLALIGAAAMAMVLTGALVEAADLKGEFRFVATDIRTVDGQPGVIKYCSEFGTITFDGKGNAATGSQDRCVTHPGALTTETRNSSFTYSVEPDGIVQLAEISDPSSITYCQLVDSGKMLLCDAYGRTDPSLLHWQAIAVMK